MLDQLRKHAASWVIKAVLTLIILTFIFFFGYSRVASRYRNAETYAAHVGDAAIPRRKYENMVQSTVDRLRDNLKGEVPPEMTGFLRQNVMEQMVTREVIVQFADSLGLTVSDEELANSIRSNKNLFPDGEFNLDLYQSQFLPSYRQRYGENYETTVRRDLLVEKTQVLMATLFGPWQAEMQASLDEMRASSPKPAKADKKAGAETGESQPHQAESVSAFDLFSHWLNAFKENVKIQVFERAG